MTPCDRTISSGSLKVLTLFAAVALAYGFSPQKTYEIKSKRNAFRNPTPPLYVPRTPTEMDILTSELSNWLRPQNHVDARMMWEDFVAEPIRRHIQHSTPTISLGRQDSDTISSFMERVKDTLEDPNLSLKDKMHPNSQDSGLPSEPLAQHGNWAAFLDRGSGLVYYFNLQSGESRWTPPSVDFPVVKAPPRPLASQGAWAAFLDETSGNVYYFNRKTGDSSWERPHPSFPRVSPSNHRSSAPQPLAASGDWAAYLDDNHRVFYFNGNDGSSVWEAPKDFPAFEVPSESVMKTFFGGGKGDPQSWIESVFESTSPSMQGLTDKIIPRKDKDWIAYLRETLREERKIASSGFDPSVFANPLNIFSESTSIVERRSTAMAHLKNRFLAFLSSIFSDPEPPRSFRVVEEEPTELVHQPRVHRNLDHLTRWTLNNDGTITGVVRHSKHNEIGIEITTTPAVDEDKVARKSVVRTLSGHKYYLL